MPIAGQSPKEVIHTELHKYKHNQLHSGSHQGPLVKNRKQAIAIALSESRKARADGGPLMLSDAGFGDIGQHRASGGGLSGLMAGITPQSIQGPMGAFKALPNVFGAAIGQIAGLGQSGTGGMNGQSAAPQTSVGQDSQALTAAHQQAGMGDAAMSNIPAQQAPASSSAPMVPASQAQSAPVSSGITSQSSPTGNGASAVMMGVNSGFANPAMTAANRLPGREFGGGMTRAPNPNWMVRNEARSMIHSGPISSIVPGRTDRHNVHVGSGSYVMPADAVSHIGQNNTKAGQAILSHMFSQGPYGSSMPKIGHGAGPPKAAHATAIPAPHIPKFQSAGGGKGDRTGEPVPVVVAGGEFTIPPETVAMIGGGDIKRGHKVLDQWVLALRKKHIATLKGLPPPAKA